MATYITALTGASGAVYGMRLIKELMARGDDVELLISPSGFLLLEEELGLCLPPIKTFEDGKKGGGAAHSISPPPSPALDTRGQTRGRAGQRVRPRPAIEKAVRAYLERAYGAKTKLKGALRFTPADDLTSRLASGGCLSKVEAMVVCPCSMGTLARISAGISANLIERAADCMLKERRALVLVPRETPLSSIHLENMLRLSRAGAVILPAMPAFYTHPKTTGDMTAFIAGKILDSLKIENNLYKKWNGR